MAKRGSSILAQLSFTTTQRRELEQLGLFEAQITELGHILPLIRSLLGPAATLTSVRKRLGKFERLFGRVQRAAGTHPVVSDKQWRTLAQAHDEITQLLTDGSKEAIEARNRVIVAEGATVLPMQGDVLRRAVDAIAQAIKDETQLPVLVGAAEQSLAAIGRAREDLPHEQRRGMAFPLPLPIARIDDALMDGFLKHHSGKPLPPYTLTNSSETFRVSRPSENSRGPASPFAEIVRICFEAVGVRGDPDRAIREYGDRLASAEANQRERRREVIVVSENALWKDLAEKQADENCARAEVDETPTEGPRTRKRGRPRKWARADKTQN